MGILITSEWPYCAYPLIVEPYHRCFFDCQYCFTKHKETWHNKARLRKLRGFNPHHDIFDTNHILKILQGEEGYNRETRILKSFIDKRIAIQIGAQTEPCGDLENKYQVTLKLIQLFKEIGNNYPIRISTKGTTLGTDDYLRLLNDYDNASVLISLISTDEDIIKLIEPNAPLPHKRLIVGKKISKTKARLGLRLRPIIPFFTEHTIHDIIKQAKTNGFQWITVEWLRIPRTLTKETRKNYESISNAIGVDIINYYINNSDYHKNKNGCLRLKKSVTDVLYARIVELCKLYNLRLASCNSAYRCVNTFSPNCCGLPLSDKSWSRMQISYAVYIAKKNGVVKFENIYDHKSPMNNLINRDNCRTNSYNISYGETLREIWNDSCHRFYPANFFHELSYDSIDDAGDHVFRYEEL